MLADVDIDIDAGETTLFLATRDMPDFVLLTGDKRALRALTNNFLSQELHNRHLGRVVCLESLLLLIIQHIGFGAIHNRLIEEQKCDLAVEKALRGGQATEAQFVKTLQAYVQWLDEDTKGLLMKF